MKIKQITNYTEYNGKYFMHLVSESGELLKYEKDLKTGEETWTQMIVPEIDSLNNG